MGMKKIEQAQKQIDDMKKERHPSDSTEQIQAQKKISANSRFLQKNQTIIESF